MPNVNKRKKADLKEEITKRQLEHEALVNLLNSHTAFRGGFKIRKAPVGLMTFHAGVIRPSEYTTIKKVGEIAEILLNYCPALDDTDKSETPCSLSYLLERYLTDPISRRIINDEIGLLGPND